MPPISSRIPPFQVADLKRATEIYLGHAYPSGVIPAAIQRRLLWPEGADASALLALPIFETIGHRDNLGDPLASQSEESPCVHCLRLGNARYPHMKLQIQAFGNRAGYMLSVNTHDQVSLPSDSVDFERFREVQRENQRLKRSIEIDWRSAGLPTFNAYLEEVAVSMQDSTTVCV